LQKTPQHQPKNQKPTPTPPIKSRKNFEGSRTTGEKDDLKGGETHKSERLGKLKKLSFLEPPDKKEDAIIEKRVLWETKVKTQHLWGAESQKRTLPKAVH